MLEYLHDNKYCFSSLELCYKEGVGIRLAVKSYSSDIIFKFLEEYPNVKKLLSNIIKQNSNNVMLEYGISFDNDIIKIYYIDNNKVIGIDIKNDIIFRIKHYMLIHDSYNIKAYEYDVAGKLINTSIYEMCDNIDKFNINEFRLFTDGCEYAYNNSKKQYYVRVYKEQFLYYYEILQQLL
jgi:hypothetical protein